VAGVKQLAPRIGRDAESNFLIADRRIAELNRNGGMQSAEEFNGRVNSARRKRLMASAERRQNAQLEFREAMM